VSFSMFSTRQCGRHLARVAPLLSFLGFVPRCLLGPSLHPIAVSCSSSRLRVGVCVLRLGQREDDRPLRRRRDRGGGDSRQRGWMFVSADSARRSSTSWGRVECECSASSDLDAVYFSLLDMLGAGSLSPVVTYGSDLNNRSVAASRGVGVRVPGTRRSFSTIFFLSSSSWLLLQLLVPPVCSRSSR